MNKNVITYFGGFLIQLVFLNKIESPLALVILGLALFMLFMASVSYEEGP